MPKILNACWIKAGSGFKTPRFFCNDLVQCSFLKVGKTHHCKFEKDVQSLCLGCTNKEAQKELVIRLATNLT